MHRINETDTVRPGYKVECWYQVDELSMSPNEKGKGRALFARPSD
jgi:hypothetical protein